MTSGSTTSRTTDGGHENWGRELLELFSLGAGNYTETDVREMFAAFTGWTFENQIRCTLCRFPWKFEYRPEDPMTARRHFSVIRVS